MLDEFDLEEEEQVDITVEALKEVIEETEEEAEEQSNDENSTDNGKKIGLFLSSLGLPTHHSQLVGFQTPASTVMDGIFELHNDIMFYLIIIVVFVLYLIIAVISIRIPSQVTSFRRLFGIKKGKKRISDFFSTSIYRNYNRYQKPYLLSSHDTKLEVV